ncbi:hypothetical protein QQF64_010391 [Cirrhinus molitorella]|uniref:Uncharacterized protein n=2 Tax=Cirrhinus molitorella TaxID=172907 RepID=A0AA88PZU3_9TELE|nr:hypothetical protein Q8A67_007474 [Cirrhinus molitorella]
MSFGAPTETASASSQPILFLLVGPCPSNDVQESPNKVPPSGSFCSFNPIQGPLPKTFKVKNRHIVRFFRLSERDIINEIL